MTKHTVESWKQTTVSTQDSPPTSAKVRRREPFWVLNPEAANKWVQETPTTETMMKKGAWAEKAPLQHLKPECWMSNGKRGMLTACKKGCFVFLKVSVAQSKSISSVSRQSGVLRAERFETRNELGKKEKTNRILPNLSRELKKERNTEADRRADREKR